MDAGLTTLRAGASDLPGAVAAMLEYPRSGTARMVQACGYAWHTVEWGQPSDPPLLLVHGVTSSSETFWRVGPCLAADRRRVVAVDLPGHGRTGGWRGRHRWIQTAADLAGFIGAAELDTGDLAVIGHSWGAMAAAALPAAGLRPERLVLLDPPALRRAALVPLTQDPTERRYENVADAIEAIRASGVSWSEGDIQAKAIALTQIDETAVRAIYLQNGADWVEQSIHPAGGHDAGYYPASMAASSVGSVSHALYWWRIARPDGGEAYSALGNH